MKRFSPVQPGPRYSWEPVDQYVERNWDIIKKGGGARATLEFADEMPQVRLFDVLDLHPQMLYRLRRQDLDDQHADFIATRLGLHPALLWPNWFANAPYEGAA